MNLKKLIGALVLSFAMVAAFSTTSQAQNLENATLCSYDYFVFYANGCGKPNVVSTAFGTSAPGTSIPITPPPGAFVERVYIYTSATTYMVGFSGCGHPTVISDPGGCEFCADAGMFNWELRYTGFNTDVTIECF
ncbi:MAG: hypothetical protein ACFB10_03300 [Salibacteraceae bacterium]